MTSHHASDSLLQLESIDPLVGDAWDAKVLNYPHHTIFHRSAWAQVLAETYGHRPCYHSVRCGGGEMGLLPLIGIKSLFTGSRGVSLPFADFAGLLWRKPPALAEIFPILTQLAADHRWKHIDLRGNGDFPDPIPPFSTYHAHQLDLSPGIEALESGLDPSVRRALRKANHSALSVTIETTDEAVQKFYLLHGRTRRRHGLPPQPYSFFQAISRHLITAGLGFVVTAKLGEIPVAAAVFLHSGDQAIYKFGASDPEHWDHRPNQLVMWAAIQHLVSSGFRYLHFGRTSPSDEGLNRFKLSWGCSTEMMHYHRLDLSRQTWVRGPAQKESHPLLFGHLPIALNQLAGRLIYPHLD